MREKRLAKKRLMKKIRVAIALLVIVLTAFWSINAVVDRKYSGAGFAFNVGSGSVVVNNRGMEPIRVEMRADGRTSSFRVESTDIGLRQSSRAQSIGREAFHAVSFELPPGETTINVTSGSKVRFLSPSSQRIDAVVKPMTESGVRTTLIFAGVVILLALYYISYTLEHPWIKWIKKAMRGKTPQGTDQTKPTTA